MSNKQANIDIDIDINMVVVCGLTVETKLSEVFMYRLFYVSDIIMYWHKFNCRTVTRTIIKIKLRRHSACKNNENKAK